MKLDNMQKNRLSQNDKNVRFITPVYSSDDRFYGLRSCEHDFNQHQFSTNNQSNRLNTIIVCMNLVSEFLWH